MTLSRLLRSNRHWLRGRLSALTDGNHPPLPPSVVGGSLIIGLSAGLSSLALRWFFDATTYVAFQGGSHVLFFLGRYTVLCIPTLGGLFIGWLVYCLARQAQGPCVPEAIAAVILRKGYTGSFVIGIKVLLASLCLGTGGSVGREGPIIEVGASLGGSLRRWLKLSESHAQLLVACGVASALAAVFNAPLTGIIFALEVVLGDCQPGSASLVVVAVLSAGCLVRLVANNVPVFSVAGYDLVSYWEILIYALLGLTAGVVGVLFIAVISTCQNLFDSWSFPMYFKPALGGLLIGTMSLFLPQILGAGYAVIAQVLHHQLSLQIMMVLIGAKMLATSVTIGSGGIGGVLMPVLFVGAMLGGSFGTVAHYLLPTVTAISTPYAVAGMAAVFAAAMQAPMTGSFLLFEMTRMHHLILPIMLTTVISACLAERLYGISLFASQLSRRRMYLTQWRTLQRFQILAVKEVMTTQMETVAGMSDLASLGHLFAHQPHKCFPVLDAAGALCGLLTMQDFKDALAQDATDRPTAQDLAVPVLMTIHPDEHVSTALSCMVIHNLDSLLVVERETRRLLGSISREDAKHIHDLYRSRHVAWTTP